MATKIYDLAVPVSKYSTRDGQEKFYNKKFFSKYRFLLVKTISYKLFL